MYLASATRLDISFAVSKLSRFVSKPGDDHWHALERVMRYLKGTASYGIHYTGYPRVLEGYSDSNWISDADEIKATSVSIQVINPIKERAVKLVRQQLLILEPGASIMLLELFPRPDDHLTLRILDAAPMNASSNCLMEDIKYIPDNLPAAPWYCSEYPQLGIARSIDFTCYTIANKYMQPFLAVPLSRSIPHAWSLWWGDT